MALIHRQNARPNTGRNWDLASPGSFGDLFGEFDALFQQLGTRADGTSRWAQGYPVDLSETGDVLILEMAVPGIRSEDLDISIEGRQLTIQGTLPYPDAEGARRYWLQTIPRGEFRRTVTLPSGVDADGIEARVESGLLTLTMPKPAEAKARKIAIRQE